MVLGSVVQAGVPMTDPRDTKPIAPAPTTVLAFGRDQKAREGTYDSNEITLPMPVVRLGWWMRVKMRIAKWRAL